MQISELGKQYLETAVRLSERVHLLCKEIDSVTGNEKLLLKRRIASLYNDIAECRKYAQRLINYHSKGE